MCAIAGFISDRSEKEIAIKLMLSKMEHRGPDDEGVFINEKKKIRLLLRFIQVKEELALYVQTNTGKKKSLRYYLYLLKLYWYKNRYFNI